MSETATSTARSAMLRKPRPALSPTRLVGRLAGRTLAILLIAGVVVLGATAFGYSALGSTLPGSFLPFGEQHQGAPPPAGVARSTAPVQAVREARGAGETANERGAFSGRNTPSIQSGLRQEAPYLVLFAGLTTIVALGLSLSTRRRRRSTRLGLSAP